MKEEKKNKENEIEKAMEVNPEATGEFDLTKEQQKEIRDRLLDVYENIDTVKPKIEVQTQEDIRLAVNSGIKELFDLGCLVTMVAIKPHYARLAIKYQDPPRTVVEDLINTPLFETIRDNIKNYNAKFALITYFERFVMSAFMHAREEGRGSVMTKYYMDMAVIVRRAERDLEALSITDASDMDISQWIKTKYCKDISPTTIGKIHEMLKTSSSFDDMEPQFADPSMADPATIFIEKERQEEFHRGIKALSDRHSRFMEAALEYTRNTGCAPETPAQAQEICRTFLPDITKEQAMRLMRASFREFGRSQRRYRSDEKPINGLRMVGDVQIMEEEENNIQEFLGEGDDFFGEDNDMIAEEIFLDDEE